MKAFIKTELTDILTLSRTDSVQIYAQIHEYSIRVYKSSAAQYLGHWRGLENSEGGRAVYYKDIQYRYMQKHTYILYSIVYKNNAKGFHIQAGEGNWRTVKVPGEGSTSSSEVAEEIIQLMDGWMYTSVHGP